MESLSCCPIYVRCPPFRSFGSLVQVDCYLNKSIFVKKIQLAVLLFAYVLQVVSSQCQYSQCWSLISQVVSSQKYHPLISQVVSSIAMSITYVTSYCPSQCKSPILQVISSLQCWSLKSQVASSWHCISLILQIASFFHVSTGSVCPYTFAWQKAGCLICVFYQLSIPFSTQFLAAFHLHSRFQHTGKPTTVCSSKPVPSICLERPVSLCVQGRTDLCRSPSDSNYI